MMLYDMKRIYGATQLGKYVFATSFYGFHISIVTYFTFVLSSLEILEKNSKSVILLLESSISHTVRLSLSTKT